MGRHLPGRIGGRAQEWPSRGRLVAKRCGSPGEASSRRKPAPAGWLKSAQDQLDALRAREAGRAPGWTRPATPKWTPPAWRGSTKRRCKVSTPRGAGGWAAQEDLVRMVLWPGGHAAPRAGIQPAPRDRRKWLLGRSLLWARARQCQTNSEVPKLDLAGVGRVCPKVA